MSQQSLQRPPQLCFLCGEKQEKPTLAQDKGEEFGAACINQKRRRRSSSADRFARGLTKLLRHEAQQRGLPLRPDGFVPLSSVLTLRENKAFSLNDVFSAVAEDQKHRFQLAASQAPASSEDSPGVRSPQEKSKEQPLLTVFPAGEICCMRCAFGGPPLFIRATQGHSLSGIASQLLLTPISSSHDLEKRVFLGCTYTGDEKCGPSRGVTLVHGTYLRFFESIKKEGLKRMQRRHVHFIPFPGVWAGHLSDISISIGSPKTLENEKRDFSPISGFRASSDLLLILDFHKALDLGLSFFLSANNVVLTEGDAQGKVPFACFAAAVERHSGRLLT